MLNCNKKEQDEAGHSPLKPVPLRIGTAEEVAVVRRVLLEAGFAEETICEAFRLGDMSDVGQLTIPAVERSEVSQRLKVLTRLFLVLTSVPRSEVEQALDQKAINSFLSLGLLGHEEAGNNFYSRVLLSPVRGFLVASDRLINADGSSLAEMPDIVFPAIYQGTLQFLRLLPVLYQGDALDLCSGTGIAAFALSRTSRRVCSVDITGRASEFARFNRALNSCENVEVLQGDLYEPVHGQTFDCIVAHPPYVPSVSVDKFWRDGGLTGEVFVRRIIEDLPKYLRTGGYCLILAQGVDTHEGKLEERTRHWLQSSVHEFDIIFASEKERNPNKVLELLGKRTSPEEIGKLRDAFEAAGVENLPYGALVLRRRQSTTEQPPWTIRAKLSSETTGADFQSTFSLHDFVTRVGFSVELAQTAPRLAPHLQVAVTHVVHDCTLVPAEYIFAANRPFTKRVRVDDWAINLFMRFDGNSTVAQIYENARGSAELPDDFGFEDFILLVTRSFEAGFLILPATDLEVSWSA